jgi:hypothetical protein
MKSNFTPSQLRYFSNFYNFGFVLFVCISTWLFLAVWHLSETTNFWLLSGYPVAAILRVAAIKYKKQAEKQEAKLDYFKGHVIA